MFDKYYTADVKKAEGSKVDGSEAVDAVAMVKMNWRATPMDALSAMKAELSRTDHKDSAISNFRRVK